MPAAAGRVGQALGPLPLSEPELERPRTRCDSQASETDKVVLACTLAARGSEPPRHVGPNRDTEPQ